MKTKNNVRKYILTIIGVVTLCFASLICLLNGNAKTLAYAAEDEIVSGTENNENATIENEVEETDVETELSTAEDVYGGVSTLAAADTTVEGNFQWMDDQGNKHPLRRVKVEVYDYDPTLLLRDDLLGTTFTDHDGNYSLSFTNQTPFESGGCDLYVKVYAGDGNVQVVKGNGKTAYCYSSVKEYKKNVAIGTTETISIDFAVDVADEDGDSNLGKAFQIAQAALTARDFAWNMSGNMPSAVKIRFPYDSPKNLANDKYKGKCYYGDDYNGITITGKAPQSGMPTAYASWDAIMHEYGHHIQKELNIHQAPSGWHGGNMIWHYADADGTQCEGGCAKHCDKPTVIYENAKISGCKIVWNEAWATVFGQVAQEYYKRYLKDIDYVCNATYDTFGGTRHIEDFDPIYSNGEGHEDVVVAILWDLFDGYNETHDNISWGYQKWWDKTTASNIDTLSEFIQGAYSDKNDQNNVGKILSYYKVAPYDIKSTSGYSDYALGLNAPTFTLNGGNVTSTCHSDQFMLIVECIDDASKFFIKTVSEKPSYALSISLTQLEWDDILGWPGEKIKIRIGGVSSFQVATGPYVSEYVEFTKPIYKYTKTNQQITITGTYCPLIGNITLPTEIDGYPVVGIGPEAFEGQSQLTSITLPSNITIIDSSTFKDCINLTSINLSSIAVTAIGDFAFENCPLSDVYMPNSLISIGDSAFSGPANIKQITQGVKSIGNNCFANNVSTSLIIPASVIDMGSDVFKNCNYLTIYTDEEGSAVLWHSKWNSSKRPVFWYCVLSADKTYVECFTKGRSVPANANAENGISDPIRSGYTFGGWYTTSDFSGDRYDDVTVVPNGTSLFAKWNKKSCVATGTMITLADGSQKAVEELTGSEDLLVWNMLTGKFDSAPILFIDSDPSAVYEIIKLSFSDGTVVKVISEHAFFNIDRNEYVFLRNDAAKYIGEKFNKQGLDGDGNMVNTIVTLTNVTVEREVTCAWSPVTFGHLCYYVNGMLSMPGATEGLINIFEVDPETMRYDLDKMNADILTYGLFTYEEFCAQIAEIPQEIFAAFNGQYLKVAIGKGLIDADGIIALIARYAEFFN